MKKNKNKPDKKSTGSEDAPQPKIYLSSQKRPILVGKDTRMPDFVVLIATLAGLSIFGLNGFIVGPMIAALFMAVWSMVAEHRRHSNYL